MNRRMIEYNGFEMYFASPEDSSNISPTVEMSQTMTGNAPSCQTSRKGRR